MSNSFCHICFSKGHETNDCVIAVPNVHLPNIDQHLFNRFSELLTLEERLFLFFTFPNFFISTKIKPVKIKYKAVISFPNTENFMGSDMVVIDKACVTNAYLKNLKEKIPFRFEHLEFTSPTHALNLSFDELFLLLSFKTRTLKCKNIKFERKILLQEIIQAAPILEKIEIDRSNIEIDDSLANLQSSSLANLKNIHLTVREQNINVSTLAALCEKIKKDVKLSLYIIVPRGNQRIFNYNRAYNRIRSILSSHFVPAQSETWTSLIVSVQCENELSDNHRLERFELKNLGTVLDNLKNFQSSSRPSNWNRLFKGNL